MTERYCTRPGDWAGMARRAAAKGAVCALLILLSLTGLSSPAHAVKVLILVPWGYGANYYLEMDNFELYGWDVTTAGLLEAVPPCGSYGGPLGCPTIRPDMMIDEIMDVSIYDCIIITHATKWITGHSPHEDFINSPDVLSLLQQANEQGIVIAAFCSGVRVLAAADLLDGVMVTGSENFATEYTNAGAIWMGTNHSPVFDGNIVTCTNGDYGQYQNCEGISRAIAARLYSQEAPTQGGAR